MNAAPAVKALSIRQPWADAIVHGTKRVENRTWATRYRGPVLIHASTVRDPHTTVDGPWPDVRSAILALARITGCHHSDDGRCCGPWGDKGAYHWTLADVVPLPEPVPCKGRLGLWTPPPELTTVVRRAADRLDTRPAGDHSTGPTPFPDPETAYANAPDIDHEAAWVAASVADPESCGETGQDYHLRKAALYDRIALADEPHDLFGEAAETALAVALMLVDTDRPHLAPHLAEQADDDPRGYVRHQYAQHTACVCDATGDGPCFLHPDTSQ